MTSVPPHPNGVTIREFFTRLLDDHAIAHKEHQAAHDREHIASQKAIDTASELARANKADANEWRQAMTDRERAFARADAMHELSKRIGDLERDAQRAAGALAVARFMGFGGLMTALAALLLLFTQGELGP